MSLAEVEIPSEVLMDPSHPPRWVAWKSQPPSEISHHHQECCERAKQWLMTLDFMGPFFSPDAPVLQGPSWILDKFKWGASSWPIHWCELIQRQDLDCGALSSLAKEVFTQRGVEAGSAQMIQIFPDSYISHWKQQWKMEPGYFNWFCDPHIYHEAVVVMADPRSARVKIWDPCYNYWIPPEQPFGVGSTVWIKMNSLSHQEVRWGQWILPVNEWIELDSLFHHHRMNYVLGLAGQSTVKA